MLRGSIDSVCISWFGGLIDGHFSVCISVHYISGRVRHFQFDNDLPHYLPLSAIDSVPKSVNDYINACAAENKIVETVLSDEYWVTFSDLWV